MSIFNFGLNNKSKRDEWLKNELESLPAGLKILDAGAGELANKKYCQHLVYVSQDFCEYNGQGNNAGLQTQTWDTSQIDIVSDITSIPEPNASYDVILCSEVLEHVPDALAVLKELNRLLKHGGTLILTAPFCSLTHFAPYHFSTGFNRYFYEHHLEQMNFQIKEISANGSFFEYLAQEIHRLRFTASAYSNKKLNLLDRLAQVILLKALERFAKTDSGSGELLCFGYQW